MLGAPLRYAANASRLGGELFGGEAGRVFGLLGVERHGALARDAGLDEQFDLFSGEGKPVFFENSFHGAVQQRYFT